MKKYVLLIALAILCTQAFAQLEMMQNIFANTDFEPTYKEGSWAEYSIADKEGQSSTLKFSVLKGNPDKDEPFVFEMKMTDEEDNWTITQFAGDDPLDRGTYAYMITQTKGEQARKIPLGELSGLMKGAEEEADDDEMEEIPDDLDIQIEEDILVQVPAGEFETIKVTFTDEEQVSNIWFSDKVGPFGMVKAEQNGEGAAELIAYGDKAESEITGKVQEIEMPNLKNLMRMAIPQDN